MAFYIGWGSGVWGRRTWGSDAALPVDVVGINSQATLNEVWLYAVSSITPIDAAVCFLEEVVGFANLDVVGVYKPAEFGIVVEHASPIEVGGSFVEEYLGDVAQYCEFDVGGIYANGYVGAVYIGAVAILIGVYVPAVVGIASAQVIAYATSLLVNWFVGAVSILWLDINDGQTVTWTDVDDSDSVVWQQIVNVSSVWVDVNDSQTSAWVPVVDVQVSNWNTSNV